MNILLAGRLGRYADRILTLQNLGHRLVYCNLPAPRQSPLPDVLSDPDLPRYQLTAGTVGADLRRIAERHEIDVVYSMKNVWDGSLELVTELLDAGVGPVVRHYKEHFCQPDAAERRSLLETAGQIYINEESLAYFRRTYEVRPDTADILDTDYLPARFMTDEFAPILYDTDQEPHLLVAGGVASNGGRTDILDLCETMRRRRVHVHIYGAKYIGASTAGVWGVGHQPTEQEYADQRHRGYVHLHEHIEPDRFTAEWSRYDAGLMHVLSRGAHDAAFQRMNRPNRMVPYLGAGLPLAQHVGGQDAMQRLIASTGIGFLYRDDDELADILHDRALLGRLRTKVLATRRGYTFENNADQLMNILSRYADTR